MSLPIKSFVLGISVSVAGFLGSPGPAGAEPYTALHRGHGDGLTRDPEPGPAVAAGAVPEVGERGFDALAPLPLEEPEWMAVASGPISLPDPYPVLETFVPAASAPPPAEGIPVPAPAPGNPPAIAQASADAYEVADNEQVRRFMDRLQTGQRRAVVERWLTRAGHYVEMVRGILKEKGLPEELAFTAMIESGFNPVAVSRAGAKGLWQFMAPTARRYGLRVDRWVDERLDPEKSTVAAARYLRDLYTMFGSWLLTHAAYNAGEGRVGRAIQAAGVKDFWELARRRLVSDETRDFVVAIQAITLIGREPDRYGFSVTPEDPVLYDRLDVSPSRSIKRIAALAGVAPEPLERLNAELRLGQTPPGAAYPIKVSPGQVQQVRLALQRAEAASLLAAARVPARGKDTGGASRRLAAGGVHVVKPRDTLGGIAKRYGISVSQITQWNRVSETTPIFPGDRLLVSALPSADREQGQGGFR